VKKFVILSVVALVAVSVAVTAAVAKPAKKSAKADVCVLLPDTKSSVRWEQFDRPFLDKTLTAAKVSHTIVNALNDPQKMRSQADQCLANGAKVIIIAPLDSGSASAIEKAAKAKGAKSIDYDRQVEGGNAVAYLSFDGKKVGVLQAGAVISGLKAKGLYNSKPVVAALWGGQTDANAFLFKSGNDAVLNPLFKSGKFAKGPQQFVPDWDGTNASTIFEQMLVKTGNKINAVSAANDNLANSVVVALKTHGLKPVPLSGQDASSQGVQNIISGWQTATVFKDVRKLAVLAANTAVQILKGQPVKYTSTVTTKGRGPEKAILIAPENITKVNFRKLFTSGFLKKKDVCNGEYAKYCVKPALARSPSTRGSPAQAGGPRFVSRHRGHRDRDADTDRTTAARDSRPVQELRLRAGAHRRRLRGACRGGHGSRR
jgi:D-xylose transport system substrate-binding protein